MANFWGDGFWGSGFWGDGFWSGIGGGPSASPEQAVFSVSIVPATRDIVMSSTIRTHNIDSSDRQAAIS